jgi:hypothetical protein
MRGPTPVTRRLARYCAGVLGLAGLGVAAAAGAYEGVPLQRLWMSMAWGGVSALILGWAVGHAAGRLFFEVQGQGRSGPPRASGKAEEKKQQEPGAVKSA